MTVLSENDAGERVQRIGRWRITVTCERKKKIIITGIGEKNLDGTFWVTCKTAQKKPVERER